MDALLPWLVPVCKVEGKHNARRCLGVGLVFSFREIQVPLDYADPSVGYAGIALIKYPAKVPIDHEEYRGPVLFNPGEHDQIPFGD